MSDYQLIAFDVDGTLLNSKKELMPAVIAAIDRVFDAGKEMVLCTGRCIPECAPLLEQLPRMRYCVCASGALVYDIRAQKAIASATIPEETVFRLMELGREEDCMLHLLADDSVVQEDCICRMDYFNMGVYQQHFYNISRIVTDVREDFSRAPFPVYKLNLYHHLIEARPRSRSRAESLGLTLTDSEIASLECTMPGINKGVGLKKLTEYLGLKREQVIAVGDADNDLEMLRYAGLPIAMGNANDRVKQLAAVIVADCDHEGSAEAIETCLLNRN